MTTLQKQTCQKIWQAIQQSNNILIPLHLNPDGDVLASALALAYIFKKLGKQYQITSADEVPDNLIFLPGAKEVKLADAGFEDLSPFDLLVHLDCADYSRFTKNDNFTIPANLFTCSIDHHANNVHFAKLNLVDKKAYATTQVLFEVLKEWKIEIDKTLASLLYFGLLTDTWFFEFADSSSPHLVAAKLLKLGAPHSDFVFQIKRQNSTPTLKYWGQVLKEFKVDKKHRFAYSTLSYNQLQKLGGKASDWQAAIQFLKTLKGIDFGFVLDEKERGLVSGSLRSRKQPDQKDALDVSKIAKLLGGGGHPAAAGFKLKMSLPQAEKYVLTKIREYLFSLK